MLCFLTHTHTHVRSMAIPTPAERKIHCSLVLKEGIANTLFAPGLQQFRDKLLGAYASQRYSMINGDLFQVSIIENATCKTDRNFIPQNILITFDAILIPITETTVETVVQNSNPIIAELEYRRRVRIDHPLITQRLGSVNNLSNKCHFISRTVEYRRNNYRMIIDFQKMYYIIQYKKPLDRKLIFVPSTTTLEVLYRSEEGPTLKDPLFVRDVDNKN